MTLPPDSSDKVLTRTDRWSKRYTIGQCADVYESRFATGELSISSEAFLAGWPTWDLNERFEFVRAFASKLEITPDDEKIIEFLISQEDERIQQMIANMVARHSDRDLALQFLLSRARKLRLRRENFLQALGVLRDLRALSSLRSFYEEDIAEVVAAPRAVSPELARDLVLCCEVLEDITGTGMQAQTLQSLQDHPNEHIRSVANLRMKIRSAMTGGPR